MFENLTADLRASQEDRVLEKNMGLWRVFFRMETPAIVCYRFGHWAEKVEFPLVGTLLRIAAGIFQRFVQILIGVYISPDAEIGPDWSSTRLSELSLAPTRLASIAPFKTEW